MELSVRRDPWYPLPSHNIIASRCRVALLERRYNPQQCDGAIYTFAACWNGHPDNLDDSITVWADALVLLVSC